MVANNQFLNVDLESWVFGTIKKVEKGSGWNIAWQDTYREIGGKSLESGKKSCPMNGAKTLYLLGRIKGSNISFKHLSPRVAWETYSKNGTYAILALECLDREPELSLADLWLTIQNRIRNDLAEVPANSNQGGPTVAYKLWHLGQIVKS